MKPTIIASGTGILIIASLAGCATHSDGRRMTLSEQWHAMAARQDEAARGFVNTKADTREPDRIKPSTPPDAIPTPYSRPGGPGLAEPSLY